MVGGTRFIGRHVVAAALARGHDVTLFHRGRTGPDLFPEVEHRLGDRDSDLSALADGEWDATVDTCAYFPRQVQALADALGDRGGHHLLVSSVSAYAVAGGPWPDRGLPARRAGRPDRRGGHRRDVRRAEGAVRTGGGGPARPGHPAGATDVRRRAGRLHLAVPVVGGPAGPWRRGPRPGARGRAGPGHRRPGHGRLDGGAARAGPVRGVPRGQPRAGVHLAAAARGDRRRGRARTAPR